MKASLPADATTTWENPGTVNSSGGLICETVMFFSSVQGSVQRCPKSLRYHIIHAFQRKACRTEMVKFARTPRRPRTKLQSEQKHLLREKRLKAAAALFCHKTHCAVSVDDITRGAKVSRA